MYGNVTYTPRHILKIVGTLFQIPYDVVNSNRVYAILQTNIERGKRGSKCLNKCVWVGMKYFNHFRGSLKHTIRAHYNFRQKANKDADIKEGGLLEH